MKTIVKNGQKYVITDALYESIKKNGLYEAGEMGSSLTVNPQQVQQTPQNNQQVQQTPQNNQQVQQNNQQANNVDTKFRIMVKNELQQNNINVDYNVEKVINLAVQEYDYNTKIDYIRNPNTNTHVGLFNEIKKEIIKKQNNNNNNNVSYDIESSVFGEVKLIKMQLKIALEDFEEEMIQEINSKLKSNYTKEDINIAQQLIDNAFPTEKDIKDSLIPLLNKKFTTKNKDNIVNTTKTTNEAVENTQTNLSILDINGKPIKQPKRNTSEVDLSINNNNVLDLINFIKDWVYIFVSKNTVKNEDFINNTKKYSKELGEEWLSNFNTKLNNYIKGGIYTHAGKKGNDYGALDMHLHDTNNPKEIDKLWNKVLEDINSLQPENEVEDIMRVMFKKASEVIDEISKDRKNEDKTREGKVDTSNNVYVMKRRMCYIFNDFQHIITITKNQAKTLKINKNFIEDIINSDNLIKSFENGIKFFNRGNRDTMDNRQKYLANATEVCSKILQQYVFVSNSTPAEYNLQIKKQKDEEKKIKNESYSKYNILFLTEDKSISTNEVKKIEEKNKKLGITYEFFISYSGFVYNMIRLYYDKIENVVKLLNNVIPEEDKNLPNNGGNTKNTEENKIIDETTETLEGIYNNFINHEAMIVYNLMSKVIRYFQIYTVNTYEKDVNELISKEDSTIDDLLRQFELYMGRQLMMTDIDESKKVYSELQERIKTMDSIVTLFEKSAKERYIVKTLDYIIRYNSKINQKMIDEILSKKENDNTNNFLRKCLAYNVLHKMYDKLNKTSASKDRLHSGYRNLLKKLFENKDIDFSDKTIMKIAPEIWKCGKKVQLGTLITILNKTISISKRFKMEQDFDISLLWDKKPIIIKEGENIIGAVTFVSFDALLDLIKNFNINKLLPKIHGKKRI